jgi:hypothetical protein
VLLLVLVLSLAVLVLVLEAIQYSNPAYWSASSPEPPRSTSGIAAVQTAIEYEYRCTEYRFAEYEYDEIRCEARALRFRGSAQRRPLLPVVSCPSPCPTVASDSLQTGSRLLALAVVP